MPTPTASSPTQQEAHNEQTELTRAYAEQLTTVLATIGQATGYPERPREQFAVLAYQSPGVVYDRSAVRA